MLNKELNSMKGSHSLKELLNDEQYMKALNKLAHGERSAIKHGVLHNNNYGKD